MPPRVLDRCPRIQQKRRGEGKARDRATNERARPTGRWPQSVRCIRTPLSDPHLPDVERLDTCSVQPTHHPQLKRVRSDARVLGPGIAMRALLTDALRKDPHEDRGTEHEWLRQKCAVVPPSWSRGAPAPGTLCEGLCGVAPVLTNFDVAHPIRLWRAVRCVVVEWLMNAHHGRSCGIGTPGPRNDATRETHQRHQARQR